MNGSTWLILGLLLAGTWYVSTHPPTVTSQILASRDFQVNGQECLSTPQTSSFAIAATPPTPESLTTLTTQGYDAARWVISTPLATCTALSITYGSENGNCTNGQWTFDLNELLDDASGLDITMTAPVATTVNLAFYGCGTTSGVTDCGPAGVTTCADRTHTQTCGSDLLWGTAVACAVGSECARGTCLAPPTTCYVCTGDTATTVPFSSATNTSGISCEGKVTSEGKTMHTGAPKCVAGTAARDPDYFKPRVVGFRVKKLTTAGVPTGEWSTEFAPGTAVPTSYVATWRPDTPIPVLVHVKNDQAKNYASSTLYGEVNRVASWLAQIPAAATHLRNTPIGWTVDVSDWLGATFSGTTVDAASRSYIDAVPYLDFGILEVAFFSDRAATFAYADPYVTLSASRTAWLPLVNTDTVSKMVTPCHPEQGGDNTFIQEFRALVSSPVDGACAPYTSTVAGSTTNIVEGGACDIQFDTRISIPYNATYLDADHVVEAWAGNAKYWLHAAIFDRCWAENAPPTHINIGSSAFDLRQFTPGVDVCCGIPRSRYFPWIFYNYYPRTPGQCDAIEHHYSAPDAWCGLNQSGTVSCYYCDATAKVLYEEQNVRTENCAALSGWTTDPDAATSNGACATLDFSKTCTACDFTRLTHVAAADPCPGGYYATTDEQLRNCVTTCSGQTCDPARNETCYANERCVETDPSGAHCNYACAAEEDCDNLPNIGWRCEQHSHPLTKVNCYTCTDITPYYEFAGIVVNLGGEASGNEAEACSDLNTNGKGGALPYDAVALNGRCDNPATFAYSTIVNPADMSKFCVRLPRQSAASSCAVWTHTRKPSYDTSALDTLDNLKIEASKVDALPASLNLTEYLRDTSNLAPYVGWNLIDWFSGQEYDWYGRILALDEAHCVPALGNAQCGENSTCVVARNTKSPSLSLNLAVYDVLKPAVLNGWQTFFRREAAEERIVETHGLCLNTVQLSWWDRLKAWIAKLFGLDPNSPLVIAMIIAGGAGIAYMLYRLVKPPRPRTPMPVGSSPPSPRRLTYRFPVRSRLPRQRRSRR